jgi:hypothetical protein
MSTQWLTVSEVAARLKISERTVQRRCKSGRLAARLETDENGAAWLVDGATLPTGAAIAADTDDNVPTGDDKPFKSESAQSVASVATGADKLPTGADTLQSVTRECELLREALQRERENADQWRAQVEAANRDAAELRAALREALRAMPKQLAAPDMSTHVKSAPGAPQARENSETGKAARPTANAREGGKTGAPRNIWRVILGLR